MPDAESGECAQSQAKQKRISFTKFTRALRIVRARARACVCVGWMCLRYRQGQPERKITKTAYKRDARKEHKRRVQCCIILIQTKRKHNERNGSNFRFQPSRYTRDSLQEIRKKGKKMKADEDGGKNSITMPKM